MVNIKNSLMEVNMNFSAAEPILCFDVFQSKVVKNRSVGEIWKSINKDEQCCLTDLWVEKKAIIEFPGHNKNVFSHEMH